MTATLGSEIIDLMESSSTMRSFVLVLLTMALTIAYRSASADVVMHPCACTTEAQWQSTAAASGHGMAGYLYSFEARQVRKFRNSGIIPLAQGTDLQTQAPIQPTVQWLVVEARYQQQFDDMLLVRDHFGKPISKIAISYEIPVDATNSHGANVGGYNAYSVMNNSSQENHLALHLSEQRASVLATIPNAGVVNALLRLMQSLDKALTNGELLKLQIEVLFEDGSRMIYEDTGELHPARVEGTAWDRNLNTIPDAPLGPGNGTGDYDIHAGDLGSWMNYMQSMGVQFTDGSGGSGSGTISCSWDGHKLTCRIPKMIQ
jgi:hypothetical protein